MENTDKVRDRRSVSENRIIIVDGKTGTIPLGIEDSKVREF